MGKCHSPSIPLPSSTQHPARVNPTEASFSLPSPLNVSTTELPSPTPHRSFLDVKKCFAPRVADAILYSMGLSKTPTEVGSSPFSPTGVPYGGWNGVENHEASGSTRILPPHTPTTATSPTSCAGLCSGDTMPAHGVPIRNTNPRAPLAPLPSPSSSSALPFSASPSCGISRCVLHNATQESCYAARTAAAEKALQRLQEENDRLKHEHIQSMRQQKRLRGTIQSLKEEVELMGTTILKQSRVLRHSSVPRPFRSPPRSPPEESEAVTMAATSAAPLASGDRPSSSPYCPTIEQRRRMTKGNEFKEEGREDHPQAQARWLGGGDRHEGERSGKEKTEQEVEEWKSFALALDALLQSITCHPRRGTHQKGNQKGRGMTKSFSSERETSSTAMASLWPLSGTRKPILYQISIRVLYAELHRHLTDLWRSTRLQCQTSPDGKDHDARPAVAAAPFNRFFIRVLGPFGTVLLETSPEPFPADEEKQETSPHQKKNTSPSSSMTSLYSEEEDIVLLGAGQEHQIGKWRALGNASWTISFQLLGYHQLSSCSTDHTTQKRNERKSSSSCARERGQEAPKQKPHQHPSFPPSASVAEGAWRRESMVMAEAQIPVRACIAASLSRVRAATRKRPIPVPLARHGDPTGSGTRRPSLSSKADEEEGAVPWTVQTTTLFPLLGSSLQRTKKGSRRTHTESDRLAPKSSAVSALRNAIHPPTTERVPLYFEVHASPFMGSSLSGVPTERRRGRAGVPERKHRSHRPHRPSSSHSSSCSLSSSTLEMKKGEKYLAPTPPLEGKSTREAEECATSFSSSSSISTTTYEGEAQQEASEEGNAATDRREVSYRSRWKKERDGIATPDARGEAARGGRPGTSRSSSSSSTSSSTRTSRTRSTHSSSSRDKPHEKYYRKRKRKANRRKKASTRSTHSSCSEELRSQSYEEEKEDSTFSSSPSSSSSSSCSSIFSLGGYHYRAVRPRPLLPTTFSPTTENVPLLSSAPPPDGSGAARQRILLELLSLHCILHRCLAVDLSRHRTRQERSTTERLCATSHRRRKEKEPRPLCPYVEVWEELVPPSPSPTPSPSTSSPALLSQATSLPGSPSAQEKATPIEHDHASHSFGLFSSSPAPFYRLLWTTPMAQPRVPHTYHWQAAAMSCAAGMATQESQQSTPPRSYDLSLEQRGQKLHREGWPDDRAYGCYEVHQVEGVQLLFRVYDDRTNEVRSRPRQEDSTSMKRRRRHGKEVWERGSPVVCLGEARLPVSSLVTTLQGRAATASATTTPLAVSLTDASVWQLTLLLPNHVFSDFHKAPHTHRSQTSRRRVTVTLAEEERESASRKRHQEDGPVAHRNKSPGSSAAAVRSTLSSSQPVGSIQLSAVVWPVSQSSAKACVWMPPCSVESDTRGSGATSNEDKAGVPLLPIAVLNRTTTSLTPSAAHVIAAGTPASSLYTDPSPTDRDTAEAVQEKEVTSTSSTVGHRSSIGTTEGPSTGKAVCPSTQTTTDKTPSPSPTTPTAGTTSPSVPRDEVLQKKTLRIHVKSGDHLFAREDHLDALDDGDPRVLLWLNDQHVFTAPPVHQSGHPRWSSRMGACQTMVQQRDELRFEVQDVSPYGDVGFIGVGFIAVSEVLEKLESVPGPHAEEVFLPVVRNGIQHGVLLVEFSLSI